MHRDEENTGDIDAAINAGIAMGEPHAIAEHMVTVLVPAGAKLEQIDLTAIEAKYAAYPRRKIGTRNLATAASFIAYVNAHKLGSTAIYADKRNTKFIAVFNDHEPEPRGPAMASDAAETPPRQEMSAEELGKIAAAMKGAIEAVMDLTGGMEMIGGNPGWGDFTATYACPLSIEWQRWINRSQHAADNKSGMKQDVFMQFLEDNLLDVIRPASGLLLQAVQSFEAKKDVAFKSAQRLEDGSIQFNYSEQVAEVSQEGKLSLPSAFAICIPVFDGGPKYEIDARLRYRVGGGGLVLWYELVSPHKIVEHAFNSVLAEIQAGAEDVPLYNV